MEVEMFENEWFAIQKHYGNKVAERSGIPLINHITEGLIILDDLNCSSEIMGAWCIHPIVQHHNDFHTEISLRLLERCECRATCVMLATEYRSIANTHLSSQIFVLSQYQENKIRTALEKTYGMWELLLADKVQNYKDFRAQPEGTYPNEGVLEKYFNDWIYGHLRLTKKDHERYESLIKVDL